MRLTQPPLRLLMPLALLWMSCDQDLNSAKDQPLVDYVVVVTDSLSAAPLDSVRVRVTTITGDTSTYFTDTAEGRVELPSVASSRTLFVLSRKDYRTTDWIDTVSSAPDTVFHRPVAKLLKLKMTRLGSASAGRSQFALSLRNPDGDRLRKGKVTFTDSLNAEKTVEDGDSDGVVELSGLRIGRNTVRVEHPGYLGRYVDVNVERLADTVRVVPGTALSLLPLSNSISGQVYYKTAIGSKPLADAKVEFVLKDSSAYPGKFAGLTSTMAGSEGRYTLSGVPALDGEMRFYKNKASPEPTLIKPITKEEVLQDGPSALVTLSISPDSLALPVVDSLPEDTLNPKDTLVFHFNQPVEKVGDPVVRLINISNRLFTVAKLDTASKRTLKIVQKDDDWLAGKTYQYELSVENAQGGRFTRPGDSSAAIKGTFYVKEKADTAKTLVYPTGLRLAFFNSGIDRRFDSLALETSPEADSTSRFARMRWNWPASGRRVDSLVVWIKDGKSIPSWTQWVSIPGFVDSTTLDFAELYSTGSTRNTNAVFPLRNSPDEEIQLKVTYRDAGRPLDSEVFLPPVKQEMGVSLYVVYDTAKVLAKGLGAKDSIEVTFLRNQADPGSTFDFGIDPPMPKLYRNEKQDSTAAVLTWKWLTTRKGRLTYSYGAGVSPEGITRFRVDLNGVMFDSKPVWQRNPKAVVGFD